MAKKSEIDRLSTLPDNILTCNIYSHFSLIDVFRTSLLSTRWRSLWKLIPHLDFSKEFFGIFLLSSGGRRWNVNLLKQKVKYLNDAIDNILLLRSGHIERFSTDAYAFLIEPEIWKILRVEQWIHNAALKEVKYISLDTFFAIDIPPSLYTCRLLRDLKLECFRFSGITAEFDGFRFLQSCSLTFLPDLTDDGLKQLIGLSPLLHKLVLGDCQELIDLTIQAPNIKSFNIIDCHAMKSLTADCPLLVELEIKNCCRLFEFNMNSCVLFHDLHTSEVQIPKEHRMLNSLRKLSVKACPRVSGLTLLTMLGSFLNLEEVHIQIFEDDHYSQQERAKGEVIADSTLPSLKKANVDISSAMKKEEAIMLAFLLNNATSLNTITVTLPYCPKHIHDKEFINKVLDLQQTHEKMDITMKIDEERLDTTCKYDEDRDYGSDDSLEILMMIMNMDANIPDGIRTKHFICCRGQAIMQVTIDI